MVALNHVFVQNCFQHTTSKPLLAAIVEITEYQVPLHEREDGTYKVQYPRIDKPDDVFPWAPRVQSVSSNRPLRCLAVRAFKGF